MPYSHHSHSGQFCGHAQNTLEEMVQGAIARKMQLLAFTEHMPRDEEDFYPEEADVHTAQSLAQLFEDYYAEATRLRAKYRSNLHILVGFESEWIRKSSLQLIKSIQESHHFDFFVGSIHHVHAIPIDFDRKMYEDARNAAGGIDERLFEDYFDAQFEMLQALKPPIVGHFDLIRLLSDDRNGGFRHMTGVWSRITRNLDFISKYGGILELNSAALRKGLNEPYPCLEICQVFLRLGGRFTLSDDSHGVGQIGTNYPRLLQFIHKAGIGDIHFLEGGAEESGPQSAKTRVGSTKVSALENHPTWALQ